MIDVSEIIGDPDFAQDYTVTRSSGQFGAGGWIENTPQSIPMSGVITVARQKELSQMPEGDRVTGAMLFYSTQQLFITHNDSSAGTSDVITWQGYDYKIVHVWPYVDYGYWKAYGVRKSGD